MLTLKRIVLIATVVVAVSASSALAGTKYGTNLVSIYAPQPAPPALQIKALSSKSQLKLSDKGVAAVSLAGVTNAGGLLVTTSQTYNKSIAADPTTPTLDGSEYVVIIKLNVVAVNGLLPVIEVPVPIDLTAGKGKTKLNLGGLLNLLPGGLSRSIEVTGAEVWGPLGLPTTNCLAVVGASTPASLMANDPACRGGTQIGLSGISIPLP